MTDDVPYENLENKENILVSSSSSLSSLSSHSSISSINSDLDCSICFEAFEKNNKIILPCCEKKICSKCVFDWHLKKRGETCMFCRARIVEISPVPTERSITIINSDLSLRSRERPDRRYCVNCVIFGFVGLIMIIIYFYNIPTSNDNFYNYTV